VRTSTLLDGRGKVMKGAVVEICGEKLARSSPVVGIVAREIKLEGFTLMPDGSNHPTDTSAASSAFDPP